MISSVRGEVLAVGLDHAVVEVGGVGLAVQATPSTLATLRRGRPARLDTALVVREDSLTLYGFSEAAERELFTLLQTVSGVGPRLAMAALAVLTPTDLSRALAQGEVTTLTSVPGIGRKGAERLVLELRDKVAIPGRHDDELPGGAGFDGAAPVLAPGSVRDQVVEALVGLGFAAKPAETAVDAVLAQAGEASGQPSGGARGAEPPEGADSSRVLRAALTRLGPSR